MNCVDASVSGYGLAPSGGFTWVVTHQPAVEEEGRAGRKPMTVWMGAWVVGDGKTGSQLSQRMPNGADQGDSSDRVVQRASGKSALSQASW